jgi:hypothetical protein
METGVHKTISLHVEECYPAIHQSTSFETFSLMKALGSVSRWTKRQVLIVPTRMHFICPQWLAFLVEREF